jgi:hypothetical protein
MMVSQEHFHNEAPPGMDLLVHGDHFHAFVAHSGTGNPQVPGPFDLNDTHAAGAFRCKVFEMAQSGDFSAHKLTGFQDCRAFFNL